MLLLFILTPTAQIHSFHALSYDRSISLFQSDFTTECDLVLVLSVYNRPSEDSRCNMCNKLNLFCLLHLQVVLPLMEKYFSTHRNYFIAVATATNNVGAASLKEKEMVARYVNKCGRCKVIL